MIKFTKEEISLCKQVAEKHRKWLQHGNWYEYKNHSFQFMSQPKSEMSPEITILWLESDCLNFLKRKINYFRLKFVRGIFKFHYRKNWAKPVYFRGKTPREVLLKAVLAVLEEKR